MKLVAADPSPITEDDGTIARALEEANVPALMMSLVQLTGDTALLDGPIRPAAVTMGDPQGGLSENAKAEIRRRALDALRDFRDRRLALPPLPGRDTLHRMMSFMVGAEIAPEYVPMFVEEMCLADDDSRGLRWSDGAPREALRSFRVLIVGAGMSGLLAAIRLGEAGIPYVVIEKNAAVGGTWFENTYPGCRVDVPNHFYSYSFAPNHDWPEHFSTRRELFAYFDRCADRYGVRPHVRFETEVVSAAWDETSSRWRVRVRRRDDREEEIEANAIVSAVGQLNRPKLPDIPGIGSFRGAAFHSGAWDHGIDLAGKRVAVVGTGASAFQIVPEIAKTVKDLVVFQRSAPWMFPTDDYHDPVSDGERWLLKHVPFYASWYRFWLFWTLSDALLPALEVDPEWPSRQSVNELNEGLRQMLTAYITDQLGARPDLVETSIPDYPVGGKRMLRDNGSWLRALQRDNVRVVTGGVGEITPAGIRTAAGEEIAFDVIVFATGFQADHFLWPMELTGREGVTLSGRWGDDPRAYLGITVPGFPNLFCLYGPNTNLVHGGSIIFHSECQVRYVLECLRLLLENGRASLECRPDVHDAFNRKVDEANARRAWGVPQVRSWYKNRRGRVTQNWPWRLVDYWSATRAPEASDFVWR